jgi:lysophospholipase L1-like esterase
MERLMIFLISLAMTIGGIAARLEGDSKAEQLLALARQSLGGEKTLNAVQGLTCAGTYERTMGDRQLSGDVTLDVQLPDKMLRTESMNPVGDMTIVVEQGINGEKLLRNQRTLNAPPGAVIRMAPPPANADAEAQAIRNARAEMTRTLLALLVASPASMPLEYSYGGEAQADDGKADVVDAKGPGSFAARIFLDQKSHRPLMLQYRGVAPQIRIQTQQMQGPPDAARAQRAEQAAHDAAAAQPGPQVVDITLYLDDYRAVDGVLLPHHISRSVDGKPTEETIFKTIKMNPAFKPDTFSAR